MTPKRLASSFYWSANYNEQKIYIQFMKWHISSSQVFLFLMCCPEFFLQVFYDSYHCMAKEKRRALHTHVYI